MAKSLYEMSLEELWQLFPIILKEHNPAYRNWYLEEKEKMEALLPVKITLNESITLAVLQSQVCWQSPQLIFCWKSKEKLISQK